jgi:hypothetical protein
MSRTPRSAIPDGECRVEHCKTTHAQPSRSAATATCLPAGRLEAPQRFGHAGDVRRPCPGRHRTHALRSLRRLSPADLERPDIHAREAPRRPAGQSVLRRNGWQAAAQGDVASAQGITRRAISVHCVADPLPVGFRPSRLAPRALGPSARRPSLRRALYFSDGCDTGRWENE